MNQRLGGDDLFIQLLNKFFFFFSSTVEMIIGRVGSGLGSDWMDRISLIF
jgi:hypothetical protein